MEDIQNSRLNRSKNKLVSENAGHGRMPTLLAPQLMGSLPMPLFGHYITQISVPLSIIVLIQYNHCRSICSCIVLDEFNFIMVLQEQKPAFS